jgi:glycine hydroxymethyltransferase
MFSAKDTLAKVDSELWQAMQAEVQRQEDHIELIASENYVSKAVMEAQGSQLTNKYAEGYPGKRYYGGCEVADGIEELARQRARQLFAGAEDANVQPHSGTTANLAALLALAGPGGRIVGMALKAEGGHLSHGHDKSHTGMVFQARQYGVDATGRIDLRRSAPLSSTSTSPRC